MNKIIKNILTKIENNGYEAYVIGGYVRDLLVGKSSYDVDICTNATPKDLIAIFPQASTKNLGGIDFKIKEYHFEITTYRNEIKYKNRKPVEFVYINSLLDDLQRRDFTINTICMNSKGEVIDLLNGTSDICKEKIKMVGNSLDKIKEDPLRILRAIRIATCLNFSIETNLYKVIEERVQDIKKLSNTRIKEEIDKILLSDNVKNGFLLLKNLGVTKILKISDYENIVPVKNLEGMYAQFNIGYDLPFTKLEKNNIDNLKKIIGKKEINKITIYKYGLFLSGIAAEILGIKKREINKLYRDLPIHDKKDININPQEITENFNISSRNINTILKVLEKEILMGRIRNKKGDIVKYIENHRNEWI